MSKEAAVDIVFMTVIFMAVTVIIGAWSCNYQTKLHEVMDCMPDGSRAAYDVCVEELYGQGK